MSKYTVPNWVELINKMKMFHEYKIINLSVSIINCHNKGKILPECLNSVLIQNYKNWEIILLDNASVDKTKQIAKSNGSKLKYYRLKNKVSLGEARNLAIKNKGELIAFLDSDDLWLKDKLFRQVKKSRK